MSGGNGINKSLDLGLRILQEAAHLPSFTLSEMTAILELPNSTVDRAIQTLAGRGYLERSGLGWRMGKEAAALWARYQLTQMQEIERAKKNLADTSIPGSEIPGANPGDWQ